MEITQTIRKRRTYHSTIKLAFALNLEKKWLPAEFLRTIPRSTAHAWKRESKEKFIGYEYAESINDNVEELKLLLDKRTTRERQMFIAYVRLKRTIVGMIGKEAIQAAYKENFRSIVKVINSTKKSIQGGARSICSFLEIKYNTFNFWKSVASFSCSRSPSHICVKKVAGQITLGEFNTMKSMLTRMRFEHWPICSVWAYAVRQKHVSLSLSSWYKYNQKFQFRIKPKKGKYKKQYQLLQAPRPNHTWHADITIVKTLDNIKHFVYLIVDNHSKFIINWKVDTRCSGQVRTQTIKEAIEQEFGDDYSKSATVDLIVDGGVENNNQTVEEFIRESHVDIHKKVALRDIVQSNAMVEASNKILKHNYLFRKPIHNGKHLRQHLKEAIYDFCFVRPHHALEVYTPFEVQYNSRPEIDQSCVKKAVKERFMVNKLTRCSQNCG